MYKSLEVVTGSQRAHEHILSHPSSIGRHEVRILFSVAFARGWRDDS